MIKIKRKQIHPENYENYHYDESAYCAVIILIRCVNNIHCEFVIVFSVTLFSILFFRSALCKQLDPTNVLSNKEEELTGTCTTIRVYAYMLRQYRETSTRTELNFVA